MKIGIVDYGQTGNLFNVQKALQALLVDLVIVTTPKQLDQVEAMILPGVGAFPAVMAQLEMNGLASAIQTFHKPILGICVGMQILAKTGYENQVIAGLGVFDCEVKQLETTHVLPHLGFKKLSVIRDSALLKGIEESSFYFMHSFAMEPMDDVQAFGLYGDVKFPAVVNKNNVYGVQFHPEKSRLAGIQLLKNFVELVNGRV